MAFKVIIVGGGPVGLTAAHALTRANIDFIVLERRSSAVVDAGSNLVLNPQGIRALAHLDLLDAISKVSSPLEESMKRFTHKGKAMGDVYWFQFARELFGTFPRVLSRHDLTKVLFESLPQESQDKILTNKKVSTIDTVPEGVVVACADGTTYSADMIIAADGAHSMVRSCMRDLALKAGSDQVNEEKPFLTTYRCLWVRFPTTASADVFPGYTSECHGPNASTQVFAGEETGVVGIYERLDEPSRERIRFTDADQDEVIERWGHLPLTKNGSFTLGDAFKSRLQSGLVSLEEGVVQHWSLGGRIVLAGDAAHKYTPSTGAGCNTGMIDVVSLINELHKVLPEAEAQPTEAEVASALKAYQEARYEDVVQGCEAAGQVTALSTWKTGTLKFMDRYLLTRPLQKWMNSKGAPVMARSPAFFFAKQEPVTGTMPWVSAAC